jgi:antitoxin (DNA-binding transcriptional repressor) of toxin-antitoxin stability system
MKTIDVTKSTSLKDLVTLANQEHEIVLTQDSQPVARVLPITPGATVSPSRTLGLHRGAWTVSDDFDDPLPDGFWLGK